MQQHLRPNPAIETSNFMTTIGYLIPEFPGQTHAFFMRERQELRQLGVTASLFSTRPPVAALARHEWADAAAAETVYLTPFRPRHIAAALAGLVWSGPFALWRCCQAVWKADELTLKQKLRVLAMIPVAAFLIAQLKEQGSQHVHIHSCANSAWLGVFVSLLSDITYSLTLHGPLHDYGPAQAVKWKHAKFVVVITQDLMQEAIRQIPDSCRPPMLSAPMGVDVGRFTRSSPYEPTSNSQEVRLVSCGRINPCKGHDDLIRAVVMLRNQGIDATLTICGSTDSRRQDYEHLLHQLIEENNLQQSVRLTGSVSEESVRLELQNAHFFCLASHKEPLGVATMEAMAMGLPVIVTRSPGVSEMITDGHDGQLVDARNPEQFVNIIVDLIANPQQARLLADNARNTVKTRFHSGISAQVIHRGIKSQADQLRDECNRDTSNLTAKQRTAATVVVHS